MDDDHCPWRRIVLFLLAALLLVGVLVDRADHSVQSYNREYQRALQFRSFLSLFLSLGAPGAV